MTIRQKTKLIKSLKRRQEQLSEQMQGERHGYKIHDGHHMRDILTVVACLENNQNADKLLDNMPQPII